MTPQERALKVAMQWQACTDPTNLRVLALMGLVQLAIEAAMAEPVEQNERYKKSIAITDRNFRRMQERHDRYRDALENIRDLAADIDEQNLSIVHREAKTALDGNEHVHQCLNQCKDEDRCLRPAGHHGSCTSRGGEGYGWSPRCDSPADFPCACGATHVVRE